MFLTIPGHHNRKLEPLYSKKFEREYECDDIYDRGQGRKRRRKKGEEKENRMRMRRRTEECDYLP